MIKVGDFVKILDIDVLEQGYLEVGSKYEVVEVDEDGDIYVRNNYGDTSFFCEGDFE